MTQRDLAQAAGLSYRAVQSWENGTRERPEPESLKALAKVFRITVAELVHGTETPGPKRGGRPVGDKTLKALVQAPTAHPPSRDTGDFHPCELVLLGRKQEAPRRGLFRILGGDPPLLLFRETEEDTAGTR